MTHVSKPYFNLDLNAQFFCYVQQKKVAFNSLCHPRETRSEISNHSTPATLTPSINTSNHILLPRPLNTILNPPLR